MSKWYKLGDKWYKRCSACNQPNYVSNSECYVCGEDFDDGDSDSISNYKSRSTGLKKCAKCGRILSTEAYNKGYDYCLGCYKPRY